jgi:hypothetical protein
MIDMNMAATKTTLTATFWLMRDSTSFPVLAIERGDWCQRAVPAASDVDADALARAIVSQLQGIRVPEHSG